jgi:hypothetical protein
LSSNILPLSLLASRRRSNAATGRHACNVIVLLCLALCGCTPNALEATASAAAGLSPAATAYVAVPQDGRFGTKVYAGSGERLARLVVRAFLPYMRAVEAGAQAQTKAAALASAKAGGFTYLIVPEILRWEDRAGAWSGVGDAAALRITIIDTQSGVAAAMTEIRRRSNGDEVGTENHPGDLLAAPLEAFAARLFAGEALASAPR